jgi:hypothetical protein
MRSWTAGKIGSKRDSSYEVSNLLAFDPGASDENSSWSLGNMVFAQPANVTGSPLNLNIVARKGGDLVCSITWQTGALGMVDEQKEYEFVEIICEQIVKYVRELIV